MRRSWPEFNTEFHSHWSFLLIRLLTSIPIFVTTNVFGVIGGFRLILYIDQTRVSSS